MGHLNQVPDEAGGPRLDPTGLGHEAESTRYKHALVYMHPSYAHTHKHTHNHTYDDSGGEQHRPLNVHRQTVRCRCPARVYILIPVTCPMSNR